MENNENKNQTFLADWLDGKLSDAKLMQHVGHEEFAAYRKLKHSLDNLHLENPDFESNYAAIKAKKINRLDTKEKRIRPQFWYAAIAATLLVFFGLYKMLVFSNSNITGVGQKQTVLMADNSKVILNSKSTLSYPSLFRYNRVLNLDGEAYFEVAKGSAFRVLTGIGEVRVLGTKFNVTVAEDYLEVICYQGKVKVCRGDMESILNVGDAVRMYKSRSEIWKEKKPVPGWTRGESTFRKTPFAEVVRRFENQYGIDVEFASNLANSGFTGSFSHTNIDLALQSLCVPMNLKARNYHGKITLE